jgi:hypothetical protein
MADRSPATLQQLSAAHVQAAARQWDPDVGVPTFSSTTPWMVDIDGHLYPTKAIVALAHSLAELGTLTSGTAPADARERSRSSSTEKGIQPQCCRALMGKRPILEWQTSLTSNR